jgi:hypothetical protein
VVVAAAVPLAVTLIVWGPRRACEWTAPCEVGSDRKCEMDKPLGSSIKWPRLAEGSAKVPQGGRGLIGYTKGAARDLAPRGITLNVVQAGLMQTYMGPPSREALKVMVSALAIQRASEPAETAPEQNRRLPAAEAEIIVRMTPPVALGNSACPSGGNDARTDRV